MQVMADNAPKPNIILINIDDLGYGDIGPFGSKTPTPNLDRMAKEGRKFTSHYSAPVCSPSRASMMTGCYPKRVLPVPLVLFPVSALGLNPKEITVAEVLKETGYATACIGKWHLGDQPEFLPTRQGFDSYYGLPYSNDMGTVEDGAKNDPGTPVKTANGNTKLPVSDETGIRFPQPPLPLLENDRVIERVKQEQQHTITQRYTEKAQQYIRTHRDGPFFLYLAHTAVHFPHYPGKAFMNKTGRGLYDDWVNQVDWSVGEILATIKELKLDEKTLIIFTSDNGGPVQQGADNAPLRGSKNTTFEGGIRVCTLVRWSGHVPADTSTGAITSHMDWLPTFAALAGGKVPADRKIDGFDITPLLLNQKDAKSPYEAFYYFHGLKLEAVRSGPWKLSLAKGELYQLEDEISEKTNVASKHPEEVSRLRALADKMKDDLGLEGIGPGCRAMGKVADPKPIIDLEGQVRAELAGAVKKFP